MPNLSASLSLPPWPEGRESNVDAFLVWLQENFSLTIDGQSLTGQILGNKPDGDNGIWFSPDSVEVFRDGEYKPITDVPIGTVLAWASLLANPPANYLFCDGLPRSKATYPQLYAVVGNTFGADDANFNLPAAPGRMLTFAGTADFTTQGIAGVKGIEKITGTNYGYPSPRNGPSYPGGPTAAKGGRYFTLAPSVATALGKMEPPQVVFTAIIRYR